MKISPLAGKPAPSDVLVDVPRHGPDYLRRIVDEAQTIVNAALASPSA